VSNKPSEHQQSITNLQSNQREDVTTQDRRDFMARIFAVTPKDLAETPPPAPMKRGRPVKRSSGPAAAV
jgi:hypothetical protein